MSKTIKWFHRLVCEKPVNEYFLDGRLIKHADLVASQAIRNHSSEFCHGYNGSGPAQLALCLLILINGNNEGYQEFKRCVIARQPQDRSFEIEFYQHDDNTFSFINIRAT